MSPLANHTESETLYRKSSSSGGVMSFSSKSDFCSINVVPQTLDFNPVPMTQSIRLFQFLACALVIHPLNALMIADESTVVTHFGAPRFRSLHRDCSTSFSCNSLFSICDNISSTRTASSNRI